MADLTNKVIGIAEETVQAVEQIMDGLNRLTDLEAERAGANINLTSYDAAIAANAATAHVTGNDLILALATVAPGVLANMAANSWDDYMHIVRP